MNRGKYQKVGFGRHGGGDVCGCHRSEKLTFSPEEMNDLLSHVKNVEWVTRNLVEKAEQLDNMMATLTEKTNAYVSAAQTLEAVKAEVIELLRTAGATGDDVLHIVELTDEVVQGDMRAVTSNAVSRFVNELLRDYAMSDELAAADDAVAELRDQMSGAYTSLGTAQTDINNLKNRVAYLESLHIDDEPGQGEDDPQPIQTRSWYVGQITKTRSEFAALTAQELVEASAEYPVTQKTATLTIYKSCWFVMVPDGTEVQSAQYAVANFESRFTQQQIENGFENNTSHEDIYIRGILYHVYVNRNADLVNSNASGMFTIK